MLTLSSLFYLFKFDVSVLSIELAQSQVLFKVLSEDKPHHLNFGHVLACSNKKWHVIIVYPRYTNPIWLRIMLCPLKKNYVMPFRYSTRTHTSYMSSAFQGWYWNYADALLRPHVLYIWYKMFPPLVLIVFIILL